MKHKNEIPQAIKSKTIDKMEEAIKAIDKKIIPADKPMPDGWYCAGGEKK